MSIKKEITNNAIWSLASHLLSRGSLILAAIILARELPTTEFAVYSYFQLTISMLATYAALGLGSTASRFFAEVGHEDNDASRKPLGSLFVVSMLVSLAAAVAVLAIPDQWLSSDLALPKWLMAAGVAATAIGIVPAGAIVGLERYRTVTATSCAYGVVIIVASVVAAYYQAPLVAMGALIIAAILKAIWQFLIVIKVTGWQKLVESSSLNSHNLTFIMQFAGPMFLVSLLSASGSWAVGRIILEGNNGHYDFALYSIGLQWYSLGLLLPGMVSKVILPKLVRVPDNERNEVNAIMKYGIFITIITSCVVSLGAVGMGPVFGLMYGSQYEIGTLFIAAYMAAAIFNSPANTFGNALIARNRQWLWFFFILLWFITIITLSIIVVSNEFGGWTGSISHGVAGFVLCLCAYIVCQKWRLI
jgi:O-antigen/teichoic acid export membrane protein